MRPLRQRSDPSTVIGLIMRPVLLSVRRHPRRRTPARRSAGEGEGEGEGVSVGGDLLVELGFVHLARTDPNSFPGLRPKAIRSPSKCSTTSGGRPAWSAWATAQLEHREALPGGVHRAVTGDHLVHIAGLEPEHLDIDVLGGRGAA